MKNVFPKYTSMAVAASLSLLTIGNSQEDQERQTGRDREGRQGAQEGELHGKIMPLKAFLSSGGQATDASNESAEMDQPLVLVVDDRRGSRTGTTTTDTGTTTESTTGTADTTTGDQDRPNRGARGSRTGERAYVLVFQNDSVKEKAERICKENKDQKQSATTANQGDTAQAGGDKTQVAVKGERSFRGGLMAIMVSDISEGTAASTTGNQGEETKTETRTERRTETQTDSTDTDSGNDDN